MPGNLIIIYSNKRRVKFLFIVLFYHEQRRRQSDHGSNDATSSSTFAEITPGLVTTADGQIAPDKVASRAQKKYQIKGRKARGTT